VELVRPGQVKCANAFRDHRILRKVDSWQIVIPTITKISPICFNADFRSRAEAEAWRHTGEAQRFLAFAQTNGHIPPLESNRGA
jgi:hypothetical protein